MRTERQGCKQTSRADYFVKILRGGERFWLKVERIEGDVMIGGFNRLKIVGVVDNDLLCTDVHGLRFGDRVEVSPDDGLDWSGGETIQ